MAREPKKDCFAYDADSHDCCICISMICLEQKKCPFYKTQAELENARKQSAKRILAVSSVNPKVAHLARRYGLSPQRLEQIIEKGQKNNASSEG